MTNPQSENGVIEILKKLEENDLLALSRTVTQGLLKIRSTDEAIAGILKYSPDGLSILRRKAVTREILFSYLDEKNVKLKLPITKNELVDATLAYWDTSGIPYTTANSSQVMCTQTQDSNGVVKSNSPSDIEGVSALAEQFVQWFYTMMNTEGIGSEHFYPDGKLKLNKITGGECDTNIIENSPDDIARELFDIKLQYGLFFNPNVSKEGTQGRMDPHGLVTVMACGTLHVQDSCVGVFEQVFALARDPYCDNNWKIKNTELNLRSKSGVIGQPSLCDSELTLDLLMLPSNS
ncbi:unnamed protein product [Phaedon cochleariae]|uniref:Uncharacterized protein n=1 Tax=Phaedon cochleariae TaxID=80249 RepID=A0A9N9SFE3_PHACE|nr:unnamed protein product [Phaedon cochleariae]